MGTKARTVLPLRTSPSLFSAFPSPSTLHAPSRLSPSSLAVSVFLGSGFGGRGGLSAEAPGTPGGNGFPGRFSLPRDRGCLPGVPADPGSGHPAGTACPKLHASGPSQAQRRALASSPAPPGSPRLTCQLCGEEEPQPRPHLGGPGQRVPAERAEEVRAGQLGAGWGWGGGGSRE